MSVDTVNETRARPARRARAKDPQGATRAIAETAAALRFRALPRHVAERAKDLVLDHLGVTLYGACLPWSCKVREIVLADGGKAASTIYGSRRVPARAAALANGTAAHAIEFDDTHDESLSHPACAILPAAFAIAEETGASGRDFLAAMVAGYEAQCRFGAPLGNAIIRRGFHPTATLGVFGATAAVANLLRLDAGRIVSAFGSGASMSSGVMQFTEDAEGTMIKRLHAGLPAERGILAARLAAIDFTGPRGAIEGTWGIGRVFAGVTDLGRVTDIAVEVPDRVHPVQRPVRNDGEVGLFHVAGHRKHLHALSYRDRAGTKRLRSSARQPSSRTKNSLPSPPAGAMARKVPWADFSAPPLPMLPLPLLQLLCPLASPLHVFLRHPWALHQWGLRG